SVLPASKKTARITSLSLPGPDARRPSGYTSRVYALGLAVRFIHLAGIILLVGAAATLLLAGRSDRPTARRWESRVLALSRAVAVLTFAAGLAGLAPQTATLEGRTAAALEPAALARVLGETQSGHVWLVRQSLLLLLAAFLAVRWDVERGIDWRASCRSSPSPPSTAGGTCPGSAATAPRSGARRCCGSRASSAGRRRSRCCSSWSSR